MELGGMTEAEFRDRPTREPRCCGSTSPCGAAIVLRRKLLLAEAETAFPIRGVCRALQHYELSDVCLYGLA